MFGFDERKNSFYSTATAKSARSPNLNITCTRNYVTTIEFFNKINVSVAFVFGQFVVLVSLQIMHV